VTLDRRASGILLHPTSLPGAHGIGDLGPAAHRWVDWLAETECGYWQVLPLGPTGYADSPYQSFSAFAGNPYLIGPEVLVAEGLLDIADLGPEPAWPQDRVDYGAVIPWKLTVLDRAFRRYATSPPPGTTEAVAAFRDEHRDWLDDYALFMAIKAERGGGSWMEWPAALRRREPRSLARARQRLKAEIERHVFYQYLFFRQWCALRDHAARRGIRIIGDIPIFVAMDSSDVWANPHLFELDTDRRPTVVAGVPPDYFSETGQLWGNPLYRWDRHRASGYRWWISRIAAVRELVDVVRIDHFRGFVDYWEIPAGAPTAATGRWLEGPGREFFDVVEAALGELPIIAEDLGELHPEVPALRDELGLPGMKILQFAFDGDPDNDFLPHLYPTNCVVYTGTHDNETVAGWWKSADSQTRRRVLRYLDAERDDIVWEFLRAAWRSRARLAVAPMQEFLELGNEARMNTPSTESGNWAWRMQPEAVTPALARRIAILNRTARRRRSG
jgi:4-alpha-glucanotransferase